MKSASPIAEPATPGRQTDEWVQARLGRLTASRIGDVVARKKDGTPLKARQQYMFELIGERLTGMMREGFLGAAMLWGIETEPLARRFYEAKTGDAVTPTGFVNHPTIPMAGCSPDGLVGYEGLIEIKCCDTLTHVGYMAGRVVPEDYVPQMHWQLACHPDRKWCDFVSFDPRGNMPDHLKLFRVRLMRDEKIIAAYEKEACKFLSDLSYALEAIESGHIESSDV